MFEIGWSEIMVIAVVAIVVVGPKDLPRLLRTVGKFVGQARRMAGDFQSQFNAALREAEREVDLMDAKKTLESANPIKQLKDAVDPLREIGDGIRRDLDAAGKAPVATPAEPVKTGAAADPAAPVPDPAAPAAVASVASDAPVPDPSAPPPPSAAPAAPVVPATAAAGPAAPVGAPLDLSQPTSLRDGADR